MSKFNRPNRTTAPALGSSVLASEPTPSAVNHQGGAGYVYDAHTALFLLGIANFVDEGTFYESGFARDDRYETLVRKVTLEDPVWVAGFLPWLRQDMYMRSAPHVGAAHFVAVRAEQRVPEDSHTRGERGLSRRTTDLVCQRADELGESIGYWHHRYGRRLPAPFKRGLSDAANRLYNGRSMLRWDSERNAIRFGDVIELCHAKPVDEQTSDVFHAALDRRHNRDDPFIGSVDVLAARAELMAVPVEQRAALLAEPGIGRRLRLAGMTWKALAGWKQGPMDATAWGAILPTMSYPEKLRNLRNFDEKALPDELAEKVAIDLANPELVKRTKQLPMRFLSAYRNVHSDRWAWPLEKGLEASLTNVPALPGRTLVLVDTSSSMHAPLSRRSTLDRWDAAALFGLALGRRAEQADVVSFAGGWTATRKFVLAPGESLLRAVKRWTDQGYFIGGGTDTVRALREHYRNHDRVIIVTDEQAARDGHLVTDTIPRQVPLYAWNLAGYAYGHSPVGVPNRYVFGGLSDAAFSVVPILERRDTRWPWE